MRKQRRLTLARVAPMAGITPTSLSLLERDLRAPSRELLFKIAEIFNVSPQYVETGQLASEDQAKLARFELWPEIIYVIANHCIVPRLDDPAKVVPPDEALRIAVDQAWHARHFCGFWSWAVSRAGRDAARRFDGRGVIEQLIEKAGKTASVLSEGSWISLAHRAAMASRRPPRHCSAVGWHDPQHASDCFEFDIRTTSKLALSLSFAPHTLDYELDVYREAFIDKVFPPVFWSAAKRWSDRRLAGWFWYLGLPADLYGPLVKIARGYDTHEPFEAAAGRFLRQCTIDQRDLFLGLFGDLWSRTREDERWPGPDPVLSPDPFGRQIVFGFGAPLSRQKTRAVMPDRQRLDLIHEEGSEEQRRKVSAFLSREGTKAAAHHVSNDGVVSVDLEGKPATRHPRLDEDPPETLP